MPPSTLRCLAVAATFAAAAAARGQAEDPMVRATLADI
jgi:hypothetical protein